MCGLLLEAANAVRWLNFLYPTGSTAMFCLIFFLLPFVVTWEGVITTEQKPIQKQGRFSFWSV
jgi:hypothetical protein